MNPGATTIPVASMRFAATSAFGLTEDDAQPAVADPDRAREAIGAAPVDDGPVLDEELERLAQAGGAQLCSSTALPSGSVT